MLSLKEIVNIIKNDGIGVVPTDTLYGLVGSAFSKRAINRIYKVKGREKEKKLINLISSMKDLEKFKINLTDSQKKFLKKVWPGKVSVIISGKSFRLPKDENLIKLLKKTGPLVAPSANPSGLSPAKNITEAQKYFGDKVDFYISGGRRGNAPSTLVKLSKGGEIKVIRGIL